MAAPCMCSSSTWNSYLGVHSERRHISSIRSAPAQLRKYRTLAVSAERLGKIRISAAAADGEEDEVKAGSKKGRQLWRNELLSTNEFESLDDGVGQRSTMERDIERLVKKQEVERLLSQASDGSKVQLPDQRGVVIRDVADKILVADFFFILFSLAWLLAGLAERAAVDSSNLIDSWLPLWPSFFQPALGVFMAGAIVSAVTKKE